MASERKSKPYHHGDLRSALLTSAEAMLERVGADAISMREITREIGVSNNAPRRHFPNKQALLDALATSGFERLGSALDRAINDEEGEFEQRVIKLARANIRFAGKHRSLMKLMFTAKQRKAAPRELIEASYRALSVGPRTIAYGQSVGAVVRGDTERLALAVFSSVEGLISLSSEGRFAGVPIERLAEDVIGIIFHGLKPR